MYFDHTYLTPFLLTPLRSAYYPQPLHNSCPFFLSSASTSVCVAHVLMGVVLSIGMWLTPTRSPTLKESSTNSSSPRNCQWLIASSGGRWAPSSSLLKCWLSCPRADRVWIMTRAVTSWVQHSHCVQKMCYILVWSSQTSGSSNLSGPSSEMVPELCREGPFWLSTL